MTEGFEYRTVGVELIWKRWVSKNSNGDDSTCIVGMMIFDKYLLRSAIFQDYWIIGEFIRGAKGETLVDKVFMPGHDFM